MSVTSPDNKSMNLNVQDKSEIDSVEHEQSNPHFIKGQCGDVPVYIYSNKYDVPNAKWRKPFGGIYIHNSKTWWEDTNTPQEAKYWMNHQ